MCLYMFIFKLAVSENITYLDFVLYSMSCRALTLSSLEVRFHIDSETHDPIDLQTKELM